MHWHWHSRVTLFCSWICWWLEGKLVSKEKNWLFIFCCLFFFNLKLSVACLKVGLHIVWSYSYSVAIIKMLCCFCDFFFPPICANKTKIRIWPLKSIFATDFSLLKEFTVLQGLQMEELHRPLCSISLKCSRRDAASKKEFEHCKKSHMPFRNLSTHLFKVLW